VFAERERNELTPGDFCELMKKAQLETYGDALDPDFLHPYMWAVKGHYYSQDLPYYNFPYAFGMLFGTGLYNRYRSGDADFVERYDQLLADTGGATANEVTMAAGFDIETESFWQDGINQALKFVEIL
jgi:oligoendopeptidase F